jgi:uncharacterized membrane protein
MESKAKGVALCAVYLALTLVFGLLPYVFLIPLLLASVTTNYKTSFVVSLFFGVVSLLYAFTGGSSIVAAAFVAQPWIPIVARLFIGVIAHGAYKLTGRLIKKEGKLKKLLPVGVAAAVGSIANTAFVISLLLLCMPSFEFGDTTVYLYAVTMLISGAIELAANVALLPPIAAVMYKIRERKGA